MWTIAIYRARCRVKEASSVLTAAAQLYRHFSGLRPASPHAAPGTPHRRAPGFRRASGKGLPAPSRGGYRPPPGRGGKAAGGGAVRLRQVCVRRGRGGPGRAALGRALGPARPGRGEGAPAVDGGLRGLGPAGGAGAAPGRCEAAPFPRCSPGPALLLRGLTPFKNMGMLVTVLCKNNVDSA